MKRRGLIWYVDPGVQLPWWMGVCWWDFHRDTYICTLLFLNLAVKVGDVAYWWIKRPFPRLRNRETELINEISKLRCELSGVHRELWIQTESKKILKENMCRLFGADGFNWDEIDAEAERRSSRVVPP